MATSKLTRLRRERRRIAPSVPTASMADIAFLLIIFFMVTTTFSPEKTQVHLPESETRTEVSREAAIIAITESGEIFFSDGEAPSFQVNGAEEIGTLAQDILGLLPDKEFVIKADRMVRYEVVDEVLEQLRNHGAQFIGLLTERRVARET